MAKYWEDRRLQLLAQMERDEAALNAKLAKVYDAEEAKLRRDIAAYYAHYGEKNVIAYRNLLASLSDDDRRLLIERMDDFGRKYPQYAHLLPVRESIYELDRLEGLQYSIWLQQMEIGALEQSEFQRHLAEQARRAANLAAEELGFGGNFYSVNDAVIRATVGARWASGKNFSDRIWDDRRKLAGYLSDDLAKGFARGLEYSEMAKALTHRFSTATRSDARRLVYTEGTFVFNEAQAQVHEQEFDYYQLSTITDTKTCKVCKSIEEKQASEPVAFKDRKPGVNFPPIHANCRCSYIVAVADWDEWIERQVAKEGGDYIQERDREKPEAAEQEAPPMRANRSAKVYSKLDREDADRIAQIVDDAPDSAVKRLYLKREGELNLGDTTERSSHFTPNGVTVNMNVKNTLQDTKRAQGAVWFHEHGHQIDYLTTGSDRFRDKVRRLGLREKAYASTAYKDGLFEKTIKAEVDDLVKARQSALKARRKELIAQLDYQALYDEGFIGVGDFAVIDRMRKSYTDDAEFRSFLNESVGNVTKKSAYESIEKEVRRLTDNQRADLSDILEGATKCKIRAGWGHGKKYWAEREGYHLPKEAFAEFFSAELMNLESLEVLEKWLPKSKAVFDDIIAAIERGEL